MAATDTVLRFRWTEQCQRLAVILSSLGRTHRMIARQLGCHESTVGRHLGPNGARPQLSSAEIYDLFEQYDAQCNMEEILISVGGSTEQARLRTSHRARKPTTPQSPSEARDPFSVPGSDPFGNPGSEEISDEQLRRDVEALVEHTRRLHGDI